jgi:sec-independent protein translocase protein TatC
MTATVAPDAVRGTMPLLAHVREARTRAVRAAVAVVLGIVVGFVLADPILDVLRAPIEQIAQSRQATLNYDSVTGAFDVRMKLAIVAGIVLSSPIWVFEAVAFIAPGLTRRERRYGFGYAAVALALFLAGCAFGFALFPHMVELLAGFASDQDSTILNAGYYIDFVLKIVLATGVAFVLPVLLVMVNAMGMLPAATIRRSWRAIVIGIVLFSAVVTPAADVLSMFLVALPMAGLFGVALLLTHLHDRRVRRRGDAIPVAAHGDLVAER